METSMGNVFMRDESMGAKEKSWTSILLEQRVITIGKKRELKTRLRKIKVKIQQNKQWENLSYFLQGLNF